MFIRPVSNSLHLLTPNSHSIPPASPSSLATTSLFSVSVSLFPLHREVRLCHILGSTYKEVPRPFKEAWPGLQPPHRSTPGAPCACKPWRFLNVSNPSTRPGPCPGSWMSVLLSADVSYSCDHLDEAFPEVLICAMGRVQTPLFSTDHTRCGRPMGTRREPSGTCSSCLVSVPQIKVSPLTFVNERDSGLEREGRRGRIRTSPNGRSSS